MSDAPESAASSSAAPRVRWLTRLRRTSLRVRIAVAAVAAAGAAVIAAVVSLGLPPSSPQEYTSLPAPCTMVGGATLARFMPDAEGDTMTAIPIGKDRQAVSCAWFSYTLRGERDLSLNVDLLGSSAAASRAQAGVGGYPQILCPPQGSCNGPPVTRRNVTGLGDQATASVITFNTASAATAMPWTVPQIDLVVRSDNAIIDLDYAVYAGLNSPPKPTTTALLADTIAMARDVVAVLAGRPPVNAAAPPAYTSPHGLLYAAPGDPCGLVKTSTLVRYAPGVTPAGTPEPRGSYSWSPQQEGCHRSGDAFGDPYSVDLFFTVYAAPADARNQFQGNVQDARNGTTGTFLGSRPVPGLGNQATAIFLTDAASAPEVDLYVWEANVAVDMDFIVGPLDPPPSRAAMLAADTAAVRDVLADLPRS